MALDLAQAQARMIMDDGTQAHDPEYPQRLLEFMRSGWQDKPLEVSTRVEAANYAKRRAQLSAAFPGETLIVATGHEKTRANDTTYSFRPGSDHAWLTGEHDPDAVLVVRPGGDAVLYVRPRSPRDTDELFRDRVYGELWTGRRHTLAEKATELGIETAPLADLPAALDDCAPGRTRVLRGLDPTVDAGSHATTLHWTRNDGHTRPGELLLMDMGVESERLYTADVTRTLPVSGSFTPLQRDLYDLVLRAQQAGIDALTPGVPFDEVNQACMRVLAGGLADLGLLPVSVDEALDKECMLYRRWSLHGFGHMLGLDVHDCARARKERYKEGTIGEGYVVTVEPGLYFQAEDELVPAQLRGIGIRIEDDVLVTAGGAVVLSAGLPRAAADVEAWLAAQRAAGPRLPGPSDARH